MIFVFSLEFHVSSEVYNTMAVAKVGAERMYYYVLLLASAKTHSSNMKINNESKENF